MTSPTGAEAGHHRSGPPPIWAARKYGLNGGEDGSGSRLRRRSCRRPPPVESVVDQVYVAKPYAN